MWKFQGGYTGWKSIGGKSCALPGCNQNFIFEWPANRVLSIHYPLSSYPWIIRIIY